MVMYSNDGAYPVSALPPRVRRSNGLTYTAEAVAEHLGDADMPPWIVVSDPPSYDANNEILGWNGANWVVSEITPEADSAPDQILGISTAGLIVADEAADTI